MKKVILSMVVIATLSLIGCKSEIKKDTKTTNKEMTHDMVLAETSFGVRGNCGMCKKTIEMAVNNVEGVAKANWDVDKKKIDVFFDDKKTNDMAIHNAIAHSGYDTEKINGNLDAYNNLPECCKYDHDMEMNQSGNMDEDNSSSHNH